ncbi:MAG: NUDIX hydrolase [Gammaproteobacteria bacterium]|nr:NUDIX hydrolase [Gammaproteobacteria bacterium]MDH5735266.1 NUDIX hydrolase [Gammaproteobacteria bacterium]
MIWKPHATVAAIIERDNHFLVVEEKSDGQIVFNQPAGHLDPDESFLDAVIRETREETAWRLHPEAITGLYRWKQPETNRTFVRVAFCGHCDDHRPDQKLDKGILRAVWMTRDELIAQPDKLRSPMVIRCIDDYLSGKRYPIDLLVDI